MLRYTLSVEGDATADMEVDLLGAWCQADEADELIGQHVAELDAALECCAETERQLGDCRKRIKELERRAAVAITLIEHNEPPLRAVRVLEGKDRNRCHDEKKS